MSNMKAMNALAAMTAVFLATAAHAKPYKYPAWAEPTNQQTVNAGENVSACTLGPDYNATISLRPPFKRSVSCVNAQIQLSKDDETQPSRG
ncbi:hypothetical protein [Kordiimonas aestuarii]|uniref:hypothetical protein n=1 Tax=Kordiimonas aestuarii TaxID=1005925 RepID=UPI0021D3E826|nr:hypothetical protein [Kordiimonas aestuarii]